MLLATLAVVLSYCDSASSKHDKIAALHDPNRLQDVSSAMDPPEDNLNDLCINITFSGDASTMKCSDLYRTDSLIGLTRYVKLFIVGIDHWIFEGGLGNNQKTIKQGFKIEKQYCARPKCQTYVRAKAKKIRT